MTQASQSTSDLKGDHLSIKMFGADATSSDNTAAIQIALSKVPDDGGSLYVPNGVFRTRTLTPKSNTLIYGPGTLQLIDNGLPIGNGLFLDGVSNVTLRDITLASDATERTNYYGQIRMVDASGIRILNVTIIGGPGTGIHIIGGSDLLIAGCRISETMADGIHAGRGCTRLRIVQNHISHTGDDGIGIIAYTGNVAGDGTCEFGPVSGVVISQNHISNLTKSVGRGIAIYGPNHVSVLENDIDTVWDAGILVGGNTGTDAAVATHFTHHLNIVGNTIRNAGVGSGIGAGTRTGIYMSYLRCATIQANTIDVCAEAIGVSFAGKDVRICHNDISHVESRAIVLYPYAISDPRLTLELATNLGDTEGIEGVTEVLIGDNTIRGCGDIGIHLSGGGTLTAKRITISGNSMYQVNGKGIYSAYSDDVTIARNRILAPTDTGILAAGGSRVSVIGNTVVSAGGIGIGFTTIAGGIATGNYVTLCASGGIYGDPSSTGVMVTGNVTVDNAVLQVLLTYATSPPNTKFNNLGDDFGSGGGISASASGEATAVSTQLLDPSAPTDNQSWGQRVYHSGSTNRMVFSAHGAGFDSEWLRVDRSGSTINYAEFPQSGVRVPNAGNGTTDVVTTQATQTLKHKDLTDASNLLPATDLSNYYTKAQVDTLLAGKATSTHVHAHTHTHADPVAGVTSGPSVTNTGTPI